MKDDETIEIIWGRDGELVAVGKWENQTFVHGLPKGFESWTLEQQRAHLKRFIAPWLKHKIHQSKALAATTAGALEPTYEAKDTGKWEKAEEKRQRKQERNSNLH